MDLESIKNELLDSINKIVKSRYRLLIYLAENILDKISLKDIISEYSNMSKLEKLIFVYNEKEDISASKIAEEIKGMNFQGYSYSEVEKLLGSTCDFLILDVTRQMRPNDIGILIELVRGGGLILMIGPSYKKIDSWRTKFHETILIEDGETIQKIFEKRIFAKTLNRNNVIYIDEDSFIKSNIICENQERQITESFGEAIPKIIYQQCLTNDQIRVLKVLEWFTTKDFASVLIKSNRGRGKSAILGLGTAGMLAINERIRKILVTAPALENIQTFFQFLIRGLELLNIKYKKISVESGLIKGVNTVNCNITYKNAKFMITSKKDADIWIVDEAASIPIPFLIFLSRRYKKCIFSSTVHGYEGTGRSFSIRFLNRLRRYYGRRLVEIEMKEPIRYAANDPIEEWLYDILLLDAEPEVIENPQEITVDKCVYEKVEKESLFLKEESKLRQIVGLYILTHYRNRPDDIALLADSPKHYVRVAFYGDKVVGALHMCYEGGIKEENIDELEDIEKVKGHLIPSVVVRYYPHLKRFAKLEGTRIFRIAVHPKLWRKGIGSWLLKNIEEESKDLDWIGSSFGATGDLLRFWLIKNNYVPIFIGPRRNPISGEYSVAVLKPFSHKAIEYLEELNREFRIRFIESLHDSYYDVPSEIAWLLLYKTFGKYKAEPKFTGSQRLRMENYLRDLLLYEAAADAIKVLVKAHFMTTLEERAKLTEQEERLLLMKVLQGRPWEVVSKILKIKIKDLVQIMKDTARKLYEFYS
jgi:tRNA(Met) cytidine acetyltransferase